MANGDQPKDATAGWMNDVQKTLAYFVTVTFVLLIFLWAFFPPTMAPESMAQLNNMITTLQTLLVGAFGFFLGNTAAKITQDAGQQKVVEKLTSSAPPGTGPVAPLAGPVVVVAWWSLLTPAEQSALIANSANDARVQSFIGAAQLGKASTDDLTYLVTKGLLTQDRATAIAAG